MAVPGIALLLVNVPTKGCKYPSTRSMVSYDDAHPVRIVEVS